MDVQVGCHSYRARVASVYHGRRSLGVDGPAGHR